MPSHINTELFREKSIEKHGDTYDYSQVEYINTKIKVKIICKVHGIFEQIPSLHLKGSGCKKCSYIINKPRIFKTKQIFIQEAINIHGNTYDYSQVEYKNTNTKVDIICKIHGIFSQLPDAHIRQKQGCHNCGKIKQTLNRTKTLEKFIEDSIKIHGDKYDYSKSNYVNDNSNIVIICKEHGEFEQKVTNHLQGKGCNKCADIIRSAKKRKSLENFIIDSKKIHDDKYEYKNVVYENSKTHIFVTCKLHGDFRILPQNLLKGKGCPICVNKGEKKLFEKIKNLYPSTMYNVNFDWCKNIKFLPFDFVIPEYNIILELDGCQHFKQVSNWKSPDTQYKNDKYKEKCANENGYSVIRLLQKDVFFDTYDWLKKIIEAIKEIQSSKKIQNYYLCNNNEYEKYILNE